MMFDAYLPPTVRPLDIERQRGFTDSTAVEKIVCILVLAFGCLIPRHVLGADKPIRLALEHTTTLHVGERAVLHIPSDRRYVRSADGAWRDLLVLANQSGRNLTFRAIRTGMGVIIISPDVPDGKCISCATLHYFITVVPQR
jgi:hypothetical protein